MPMGRLLLQNWATVLAELKRTLGGIHCRRAIKNVVIVPAHTNAIAIQEAILKARIEKIVR